MQLTGSPNIVQRGSAERQVTKKQDPRKCKLHFARGCSSSLDQELEVVRDAESLRSQLSKVQEAVGIGFESAVGHDIATASNIHKAALHLCGAKSGELTRCWL